jgi:aldose 1-epimerase
MSHIIKSKPWGVLANGEKANLFALKNANNFEAWFSDYGCAITHLWVPKADGTRQDVVLGFDNLGEYLKHRSYFGCVVGRYANRIAKGSFDLDGDTYTLAKNLQTNHLHGGTIGFDKVLWQAELFEGEEPAIQFSYLSPDGEEGYPGNLAVKVKYTLKADNTLDMSFSAETDKATVLNLTNHTYFNFSGGLDNVLNYEISINADKILEIDSTLIPTGNLLSVKDTVFDFLTPQKIGTGINKLSNEQLRLGSGYDHCYALNNQSGIKGLVAKIADEKSGIELEISSTEPGVQLYSANHVPVMTGKSGISYKKHHGICFETQHFPDAPNQPNFKSTVLRPGEKFHSETSWRFTSI